MHLQQTFESVVSYFLDHLNTFRILSGTEVQIQKNPNSSLLNKSFTLGLLRIVGSIVLVQCAIQRTSSDLISSILCLKRVHFPQTKSKKIKKNWTQRAFGWCWELIFQNRIHVGKRFSWRSSNRYCQHYRTSQVKDIMLIKTFWFL